MCVPVALYLRVSTEEQRTMGDSRIALLVFGTGVMNAMTAKIADKEKRKMTTFTIDETNNITAFANAQAAAAASTTPFDLLTNQKEFAELMVGWPAERVRFSGTPGWAGLINSSSTSSTGWGARPGSS